MSFRLTLIAGAAALTAMGGVALADVPGADWMTADQLTRSFRSRAIPTSPASKRMTATGKAKA